MNRRTVLPVLPLAAWGLSVTVVVLAIAVWGNNVGWQVVGLVAYSWFPLFGLTAFSLMWAHYIITVARRWLGEDAQRLKRYYSVTSWVVLGALLAHPGLLSLQLWADGFGLPPKSYLIHYVAPELGWVALLGTMALGVFLAYEFWRWFDKKPWWRWVSWASEFAMIATFYHALRLGGELQISWFRTIWYVYGITLVMALSISIGRHIIILILSPGAAGER